MPEMEEIREKKNRVRSLLEPLGLDGVYLKKQQNFSWLTAGGLNVVGITLELGVAGLLITAEREYAICSNIEALRMEREERLPDQGYEIRSFPWYEEREADLVRELAGKRIGADHAFPGGTDISARINPLRYSLMPQEVERYRTVGELTSRAVEETAATVEPGDRECAVVGRLAERLWADRLDYITTFCAADERIADYRHPIATERPIRGRAMLCVNGRKWGLIVTVTRFVHFGRVPAELLEKYRANVRIECVMMAATVPGRPAAEAFLRGLEAYREAGCPEEWRLHHQGGSTGYTGRDYKVTAQTREVVQENQAFCWNPTITGCKSEDTFLATTRGPELLSGPVVFPVMRVEAGGHTFRRPAMLEK